MKNYPYPAFSGYGVEVEYMIVSTDSLDIKPVADQLLELVGGAEDMDVERGEAAWSNELALHVIEVKTNGPSTNLERSRAVFHEQVKEINRLLDPLGACLMPGGMHPWMDPMLETRLWPHQNNEIYAAFDRIFNCRGHGWSNLQSTHINFPFSTPDEFARLHAACRFVLPLIPALAASSPYYGGARGPGLSSRLMVYRQNCRKVPSVAGSIVPERVYSEPEYLDLLDGIYADMCPHDPEGVLAHEWLNARGAIARFDRGAIEIRLIDAQESPTQDFAVVSFVTSLVRHLAEFDQLSLRHLQAWDERPLLDLLLEAAAEGRRARVPAAYAEMWGTKDRTMGDLLRTLARRCPVPSSLAEGVQLILDRGNLAERLVRAVGQPPEKQALRPVYEKLCQCLANDTPFLTA